MARRSATGVSRTGTTTCSMTVAARYADYSGCGNTLDAGNPIVRRLILDSLRYWVREMHVDGFRFDLAAVAVARPEGQPHARTRRSSGTSTRPGAGGRQAHRGGMGRGRPVPGRQLRGQTAGASGTAASGTTCARSSRATRASTGAVAQRFLASPDIYGAAARPPADDHQLRDLPRRLHPQRPGLVLAQAQRGQWRRTAATAATTTAAGAAARTDRPTTPRSSGSGAPGAQLAGVDAAVDGRADAAHGRRGPADAGRQQQRLLPRRRATPGSTGTLVERHADCSPTPGRSSRPGAAWIGVLGHEDEPDASWTAGAVGRRP